MKENLFIGFGSEILADQSIVPALIQSLKPVFRNKIDFHCELISSLDLVNLFEGYKSLLILDTTIVTDSVTGMLHFKSLSEYKPSLHLENYHDTSITETFEIADKLGIIMPQSIGIVTISVKDVFTLSNNYSKVLKQKYPVLLHQLKTLIRHFYKPENEKMLVVD